MPKGEIVEKRTSRFYYGFDLLPGEYQYWRKHGETLFYQTFPRWKIAKIEVSVKGFGRSVVETENPYVRAHAPDGVLAPEPSGTLAVPPSPQPRRSSPKLRLKLKISKVFRSSGSIKVPPPPTPPPPTKSPALVAKVKEMEAILKEGMELTNLPTPIDIFLRPENVLLKTFAWFQLHVDRRHNSCPPPIELKEVFSIKMTLVDIRNSVVRVLTSANPKIERGCFIFGAKFNPDISLTTLYQYNSRYFRERVADKTLGFDEPEGKVSLFSNTLFGIRPKTAEEMRQMAFYLEENPELHTMYEHYRVISGRDVAGLTTLGWLIHRIAARDDTDGEFYDSRKQAIEQHYSAPDKKIFMELPDLRVACGFHVRVPSYEETPVIVHIARKQNYLYMPLDIADSSVLGIFAFRCLPDYFSELLSFIDRYVDAELDQIYRVFGKAGRIPALEASSQSFMEALPIAVRLNYSIMNLSTTPEELVYELFETLKRSKGRRPKRT